MPEKALRLFIARAPPTGAACKSYGNIDCDEGEFDQSQFGERIEPLKPRRSTVLRINRSYPTPVTPVDACDSHALSALQRLRELE